MSVSLLLGLVYLISELLLTATRRSRSRTGTKQDRSTLRVVLTGRSHRQRLQFSQASVA